MAYSRAASVTRLRRWVSGPIHRPVDPRSTVSQPRLQQLLSSMAQCPEHKRQRPSSLVVHCHRPRNTQTHETWLCCRETSSADRTACTASERPVHPTAITTTTVNLHQVITMIMMILILLGRYKRLKTMVQYKTVS